MTLGLAVGITMTGVGLWLTWDSTQTTVTSSLSPPPSDLTATTTTTAPTTSTTAIPPCTYGDTPTGDPDSDWATIVVDTERRLPPDYVPDDLVEVTAAGFAQRDPVRELVVADLAALREGAEANGTPLVVVSAYRSSAYQQGLYDGAVEAAGKKEARATVARAGHSEHQLGTAVDVLDAGAGELSTAFADTPAGQWVAAHAHEYGFVLSYPHGGRDRACYRFEPWHLRYVGRSLAAEIHESGLSPREWLLLMAQRRGG